MALHRYVITEEVAQSLLDYLATRPYCEVFKLIQALQQSPKISGTGLECDKPAKKDKTTLLEQ